MYTSISYVFIYIKKLNIKINDTKETLKFSLKIKKKKIKQRKLVKFLRTCKKKIKKIRDN